MAEDRSIGRVAGFSLLEVVIAIGLIGLTAAAFLSVQGDSARNLAALEKRTLADILAENRMVELALGAVPPIGISQGTERLGGILWRYEVRVAETVDPALRELRVDIRAGNEDQVLASLTAFRAP